MTNSKSVFDISGADNVPNLPIEQIDNERQTLVGLLVDDSGSLKGYEKVMRDCLEKFKSALLGSKQEDEMLVSLTTFGGQGVNQGGYQLISDMPTDYSASGMTPLYDCIVQAGKQICDGNGGGYLEQLQQSGIKAKGVIAIFSDGEDTASSCSKDEARKTIEFLKKKEIIVAFVAFGDDARGIADELGVDSQNVLDVSANESELRKVFQVLSKSAVSASKNAAAGQSSNAFYV